MSDSISSECEETQITWVSDFESFALEDLREFLWHFKPGDVAKTERPDKRKFKFPEQINIISFGPARSGKSSYINSLLSLINPATEVFQIHSDLGTDSLTGTVRLEGPFCLNDFSDEHTMQPKRSVIRLWTTMGSVSYLGGSELERQFLRLIKNLFLGKIKPGEYTGLLPRSTFNPLLKRVVDLDDAPKYDLALITARYGVKADAEQAVSLYSYLSKQNNIPTIVLVTHASGNTSWDALNSIDAASLHFVENYLPQEALEGDKSKRLLIPLLEAVKKIERSDIYWSRAEESCMDKIRTFAQETSLQWNRVRFSKGTVWIVVVLVFLLAFVVGFLQY